MSVCSQSMGGLNDYKPAMAMIGLQCIYTGLSLFTRAALLQGMSPRVFFVYRQGVATLIIAPIACFTRWYIALKSYLLINLSVFFFFFFCPLTLSHILSHMAGEIHVGLHWD